MSGATETDVIVLGVGTCGEDVALQLLAGGAEVIGIEASLVGGECPYWACLPSKRLLRNARMLAEARRADDVAGQVTVEPDWAMVAAQVRAEVTGGWDDTGATERFRKRGGTLVRGRGRLTGARDVEVDGQAYHARTGVIIATGSELVMPPIEGLAERQPWTSHDVIAATELPASLAVIGGGVVGCELGQLLARFGVAVTIIEAGEQLLPGEEPEASTALQAALEAEGLTIHVGTRVTAADETGLILADDSRIDAEQVLVATGRRPATDGLGLEVVGLEPGPGGIPTDGHMRVADGVWAIGDVTGRGLATHVALYQGGIAVADILGRPGPEARYHAVPRVTFTDPEVASVGLTEAAARASDAEPVVVVKQLGATFRGWLHRDGNAGLVKLVVDPESTRVLGATAVGPDGGEVVGPLALAVSAGLPLSELRGMIYAFPTLHGAIGEAIGAYGRGITTVLDPGYDGVARLDEIA